MFDRTRLISARQHQHASPVAQLLRHKCCNQQHHLAHTSYHMDHQTPHLRDAGLSSTMLQLLTSHNLKTCRDVLIMSSIDLMELLNIPHSEAEQLLMQVAINTAPAYGTALQLHTTTLEHSVKVLTGLSELDHALRIGLPPGAITELVGPAGVGKSQMCYGLALQVALPRSLGGLEAMLMYIDTEGKFSSQRLLEMAGARLAAATAAAGDTGQQQQWSYEALVEPVLNRVLVMKPSSVEMLQSQLEGLQQEVSRRDIKLVLLDSIAALLRTNEYGGTTSEGPAALAARGELLGQQAAALKALAEKHRIPVVVTNQVTARPTGAATHTFQQQQRVPPGSSSAGGQLSAALGTKWAHAVNVRLILERHGDRRFIKIAKSPISANHAVEYCITPAGIEEVLGSDVPQALQQSALEMQIANEYAGW